MSLNILRFMIPKSLVVYITVDSTVRQALEKMNYHRYIAVPVIDREGKYAGTLRSDDIFKYFMQVIKRCGFYRSMPFTVLVVQEL